MKKNLLFVVSMAWLTAGCPAPPKFLVADVTTPSRQPVPGALVAAECGDRSHPSRRATAQTDERGHAHVAIDGNPRGRDCLVTVAQDGFETVEQKGANLCSTAAGCPSTTYQLRRTSRSGGHR